MALNQRTSANGLLKSLTTLQTNSKRTRNILESQSRSIHAISKVSTQYFKIKSIQQLSIRRIFNSRALLSESNPNIKANINGEEPVQKNATNETKIENGSNSTTATPEVAQPIITERPPSQELKPTFHPFQFYGRIPPWFKQSLDSPARYQKLINTTPERENPPIGFLILCAGVLVCFLIRIKMLQGKSQIKGSILVICFLRSR
jgi:hypothetical protein